MPLAATALRNAKAAAQARKLFDDGRLYLEVAPSEGLKLWWLKYCYYQSQIKSIVQHDVPFVVEPK